MTLSYTSPKDVNRSTRLELMDADPLPPLCLSAGPTLEPSAAASAPYIQLMALKGMDAADLNPSKLSFQCIGVGSSARNLSWLLRRKLSRARDGSSRIHRGSRPRDMVFSLILLDGHCVILSERS